MRVAEKYNVDQMYYYHLRDFYNRPVVTVCVVRCGDNYSRGVSICSLSEMPVKRIGRRIARDRALNAIFNKISVMEIKSDRAQDILENIFTKDVKDLYDVMNYKSQYNPDLTWFEKILFGLIERNMN